MIRIAARTAEALGDAQLQRNLRSTLTHTLKARDQAVSEVDNWEELREYGRRVKSHTLARLDHYLELLQSRIEAQGGHVLWAEDGAEASRLICDIARRKGVAEVIKSKSMTGEEIHLNEALERSGIEPVESDLGEYIVQLAGQTPSHIIAPALHMSQGQVTDLFVKKLGIPPTDDIEQLTATARSVLRQRFLDAGIGFSGVNFAIAETGTLVVVENEGNARLSTSAPRIHVALMGIEKVLPRSRDLSVFLRLLIRSATGQRISSYVNFINGPARNGELDGPEEFYLVLLDNGRSRVLADRPLRQTLACVRCGACQNVCPVFQRIGGHAYGTTYHGPIGAILSPQILSLEEAPEHPFASSLCGACGEICPVKIEIPHILLELRQRIKRRKAGVLERAVFRSWAKRMSDPRRYTRLLPWIRRGAWLSRGGLGKLAGGPVRRWLRAREMPEVPRRSFREQYEEWRDSKVDGGK